MKVNQSRRAEVVSVNATSLPPSPALVIGRLGEASSWRDAPELNFGSLTAACLADRESSAAGDNLCKEPEVQSSMVGSQSQIRLRSVGSKVSPSTSM